MLYKAILAVLLFVCVASAVQVPNKLHAPSKRFLEFVTLHNKQYSPVEYIKRQQIFLENVDFIEKFNEKNTYQVGLNEFADMTREEFATRMLRQKVDYSEVKISENVAEVNVDAGVPASVDWRTHTNPTVVGPVRDAGQCGSSDALAIVDSISGDYSVVKNDDFYEFNSSYITDCDGEGCNGAAPDVAWKFVLKWGLSWYYTGTCPNGPVLGICISNVTTSKSGDETALQSAVAYVGPVVVMVDASHASFQMYTSGIYDEPACSSKQLDHAMLLVGYGTQNGQDYWIVRNSWGTSWGMNGDMYLVRNKNNACGIATAASYAVNPHNCSCK